MPTYRALPDNDAATVDDPPTDGSIAPDDAWEEVDIGTQSGTGRGQQWAYFLAAKAGLPSFANWTRTGSA